MRDKIGDIGFIIVDCNDNELVASFWSKVLGLDVIERSGHYIDLAQSSDSSPAMCFQKVDEPKINKNRVHVDVEVANLLTATKHIEALGGSLLQELSEGAYKWRVMADPENNEFCVYLKK